VKPTRPLPLAGITVIVALLSLMVVRLTYSDLPLLTWTAIPVVLLMAFGEAYSGWMTRLRLARKGDTKPVEPLVVARLAALAKATAYTGAVFGGLYAGVALHTMTLLEQETPRREFFIATGSFLSFVALIGAALFLEHSCRVPKTDQHAKD